MVSPRILFARAGVQPCLWCATRTCPGEVEPDVLLRVGSSHPVGKPVIELARRLLGTCRITISCQDRFLLRISYGPRTVNVRDAGERCLHLSRRERMIRHSAKAARLVDVNFAAVLPGGYAD